MLHELLEPGYLHILLNHLPIFGTALGALALLVALGRRPNNLRRVCPAFLRTIV